MPKTTLSLPADLKEQLGVTARERGCSEAELIREALRAYLPAAIEQPTVPLVTSGDHTLAERVDQALLGFGEG